MENPGFPTATGNTAATSPSTFTYTIVGDSSICQTRIDFVNAVFRPPTAVANGVCTAATDDILTVTSPSTSLIGFENLCGVLTNQHIYVHNDGGPQLAIVI